MKFMKAVAASALAALAVGLSSTVATAQDAAPSAYAFGGQVQITDQDVIPPTPEATVANPGDADVSETTIDIPADPIAVSGTLKADAKSHTTADVQSALAVNAQELAGPYHASGVGTVENADVLIDAVGEGISLVHAAVLRGEAVVKCTSSGPQFSANSEIVDLVIGGEPIPDLNAGLEELIDALNENLFDAGLEALVDIDRNVVTETADGIAVDALVVTVLEAAGDTPLATVRLGHGAVSGKACDFGGGGEPECSDDVDNDDPEDTVADEDDPGCHSDGDPDNPDSYDPEDDDETDVPECSDTGDNDDDGLIDEDDPGCLSGEGGTYNPNDDDETDSGGARVLPTQLPRTGGGAPGGTALVGGLAALAVGSLAVRRRLLGNV